MTKSTAGNLFPHSTRVTSPLREVIEFVFEI